MSLFWQWLRWKLCTCGVGGRTVAQFVADRAGKVAAEGHLGHIQRCSVFGDSSHSVVDSNSLIEPAEVGVCPPGFATNQWGMRYVDAHWDVVHRLCKDTKPPAGWGRKEAKLCGVLSHKHLSVKNNGTWLFKGVCQKESWETFKAVRRNWLSFRDGNEAGEHVVMRVNVTVENLEAVEAGVEKTERMNHCCESRQEKKKKSKEALTQN